MNEIRNERLNERFFHTCHKSGLNVYTVPKAGFAKTYAIFATKYGSVDNRFTAGGETTELPDGIAHFLEHKLFESERGSAFDDYAKTGASANAFTSFDKTAYLFSCTDQFEDSMRVLLNFVQNPYFTRESVEKEQGIIGQEIRMYDDDPSWQVMMGLLTALYHNNPVNIDIAGTCESIAQITDTLLYQTYETFYNLHNMILCVVGDKSHEEVMKLVDECVTKKAPALSVERGTWTEPAEVKTPYVEKALSVSKPQFMLGFKDGRTIFGKEGAKNEAAANIALQMLAGKSGELYDSLYREGLINNSFGFEMMTGRNFSCALFAGESRDPKAVAERILEGAGRLMESDDTALFERCKKVVYGEALSQFDEVESIGHNFIAAVFQEGTVFDRAQAIADVDFAFVKKRMHELFTKERMALSVVVPNAAE